LVALDSRTHSLRSKEPAFEQMLREIRRFLDVPA
jgi:hypothetical protein